MGSLRVQRHEVPGVVVSSLGLRNLVVRLGLDSVDEIDELDSCISAI